MIVVASIDPEALRERSDADGHDYHVLKNLAKVLRQHGVLHLTGQEDSDRLYAAVGSLDPMIRETWEQTLVSLGSLDRIRTDMSDVPTHESCMAKPLLTANLRPSDLVVLSDAACDIQGVPRRPGHLHRPEEPELASAAAVPTCETVESVDELVQHPYTGMGESRELVWTTHMAPLARLAHQEVEVRVLDRYLFTRFFKTGAVRDLGHVDWLLAKLNEGLPAGVKVHLLAEVCPQRKDEPDAQWNRRRKKRISQLRQWLQSHAIMSERPGALQVSLSRWLGLESESGQPAGKPHDRHIRFNTWVALATPEGFDRVREETVLGEDGMVLNRVMSTNDEGRVDYFKSLTNKEDAVLKGPVWNALSRPDLLDQLQRGQIRSGVVSSIVKTGVYVDLGGVDGLVHVSELSWKHIHHPNEVVAVGDEVIVEVLAVDMDRERVSLSMKSTQEDPWQHFARTHQLGQDVPGKVTKLVPFGAFVRVEEGIEGLVHISELAERHVETPEQVVTVNDEISVKVIDIDLERRRISLSLKQASQGGPPE